MIKPRSNQFIWKFPGELWEEFSFEELEEIKANYMTHESLNNNLFPLLLLPFFYSLMLPQLSASSYYNSLVSIRHYEEIRTHFPYLFKKPESLSSSFKEGDYIVAKSFLNQTYIIHIDKIDFIPRNFIGKEPMKIKLITQSTNRNLVKITKPVIPICKISERFWKSNLMCDFEDTYTNKIKSFSKA